MTRFSDRSQTSFPNRRFVSRAPLPVRQLDIAFETAIGNRTGFVTINKFGTTTNADSGIPTDVWNRANVTDNQPIWIPPTTARVHDLASTSADDADAGLGARTVLILGLVGWNQKQVSELVTLNGTTPVATTNSWVIIYRMIALTWGASGPNVGTLTATAQVDATVTAQIDPGDGQTSMAILGVPSVQVLVITQASTYGLQGIVNADIDMRFLVNQNVETTLSGFITSARWALKPDVGNVEHTLSLPATVKGPMIVKMQAISDSPNSGLVAGFDAVLVDVGLTNL